MSFFAVAHTEEEKIRDAVSSAKSLRKIHIFGVFHAPEAGGVSTSAPVQQASKSRVLGKLKVAQANQVLPDVGGFWVGWAFLPAFFIRSGPVHNGNVQSDRICTPSFKDFIAS